MNRLPVVPLYTATAESLPTEVRIHETAFGNE